MRALSSRPFWPCDGQWVSLGYLSAGLRYTTHYLKGLPGRRKPRLDDAPLDVVDPGWKRLVIDKAGELSQPAYTLGVMERLQDRLRRRAVYVEAAERWSDPRAKLLQGTEWESKRTTICQTLGHSTSSDDVVKGLRAALDETYRRVSARFANNEAVRIA